MTLPEQAQFRTQDPTLLGGDLDRAYRAIREEFRLAGKFFAPGPVMAYPNGATYAANPWECVVITDTCTILLPSLGPESAGVAIECIRRGGTLTVKSDTSAQVQAGTSDSVVGVRRLLYRFDGLDWWR